MPRSIGTRYQFHPANDHDETRRVVPFALLGAPWTLEKSMPSAIDQVSVRCSGPGHTTGNLRVTCPPFSSNSESGNCSDRFAIASLL
jgi:hypothetical protein